MGMSVFLGMELCTEESSNDYLLFGVTEDFVYDNPRLYEWSMADVCRLAKRYGILVFQAHPYRAGLMFTPGVLDGVEVCNANPRENSQNHLALAASLEHSLLQSSGSDCHRPEDVGRGGIQTDRPLTTAQQFRDIFLSGQLYADYSGQLMDGMILRNPRHYFTDIGGRRHCIPMKRTVTQRK